MDLGDLSPTGAISVVASGPLSPVGSGAVEGLPAGTALLLVRRGPGEGSQFVLSSDLVTAGRAPDADIFLDDVTVSRRHADFVRTADGWEVVDQGSLNGTYVDHDVVDRRGLSGGEEVQIGKYRFVFLAAKPEPGSG